MTIDSPTPDDIRAAVLAQWHGWRTSTLGPGHKATVADAIRFCAYLSRKRSDLLNRCPPGDPWQHIRTWLLEAGLVAPMPVPSVRPRAMED